MPNHIQIMDENIVWMAKVLTIIKCIPTTKDNTPNSSIDLF